MFEESSFPIIPDSDADLGLTDAQFVQRLAKKAALADEMAGKKYDESLAEYSRKADMLQEQQIRDSVSMNAAEQERLAMISEMRDQLTQNSVEETADYLQRISDIETYEAVVEEQYVERLAQFRDPRWLELDEENVDIFQRRKERMKDLHKLQAMRAKYAALEDNEGWFAETLDFFKAITGFPNLFDNFNLTEGTPYDLIDEFKRQYYNITQLPEEEQTEAMERFARMVEDTSLLLDNPQDVVDKIDLMMGTEEDLDQFVALSTIDLVAVIGLFQWMRIGTGIAQGRKLVDVPDGRGITKKPNLEAVAAREIAGEEAVAKDIVNGEFKLVSPDEFLEQGSMLRLPASAYGTSISSFVEQAAKRNQEELLLQLDEFAAPERLATVLRQAENEFATSITGRGILSSSFDEITGKINLQIGTTANKPFKTKKTAQQAIDRLELNKYDGIETVKPQKAGGGWVIRVEHTDGDALRAWQKLGYIGKEIKNIQDVVPAFAKLAQQADDAQRAVNKAIERVFSRDLRAFVGKKGKNMMRVIKEMQQQEKKVVDELNGKEKVVPSGRWYSVDDFINRYDELNGKLPTENEVKAFVAYRQLNDFAYELKVKTMAETVVARGDEVYPIMVNGKQLDTLAHKANEFQVFSSKSNREAIFINGESPKYFPKGKMTKDDIDELEGYDIISINPAHREDMYKIGQAEAPIQYMAIPKGTKPRDFTANDISRYLGGGRVVDASPFYIKVGKVAKDSGGQSFRLGDTTLFSASSVNDAKKGARQINNLVKLMRENVDDLAKVTDEMVDAVGLSRVGIRTVAEADQFMKNYKLYGGEKNSVIDWVGDREIVDMGDVARGRNVDYSQISNNSRSQIMGERTTGLKNIQGVDSTHVDPLASMVKSMNIVSEYSSTTALRERALAYFKRNFGSKIDTDSSNPYDMLYANVNENVVKQDPQLANAIVAHQRYLKNMLNFKSPAESNWNTFVERLFTGIFKTKDRFFKAGQIRDPAERVAMQEKRQRMIEIFGVDPASKVRTLTFHNTLGMLNPASFIMQWVNVVNIMAVAGKSGIKAGAQALPLRAAMLSRDPEVLAWFARHHARWGFKSEQEVTDLVEEMWLSGLDSVGSTHMLANGVTGLQLQGHARNRIKNLSTTFFDQGEILNRITARTAATHEWRKLNPDVPIKDPEARRWIGGRMHDLTLGMSRSDTQLLLREGIPSMALQFWSYPMRLTAAMLPKAMGGSNIFKGAEKAKVAAVNLAMWGGAGIPLVGYFTDWFVENHQMEHWQAKAVANGLFDTAMYALSGNEIDSNMSDRVGLHQFYAPIFDSVLGDKTAFEVIGGASASRGTQMFGAAEAAWSILEVGSTADWNNLSDAGLRLVAGISSGANNWFKFHLAMKFGKIQSRNGNAMANVTNPEAFAMLMGIPPQAYADISLEYKADKKINDLRKEYKELYLLALRAIEDAETEEEYYDAEERLRNIAILAYDDGVGSEAFRSAILETGGGDWMYRQGEKIIKRDLKGKPVTEGQRRRVETYQRKERE